MDLEDFTYFKEAVSLMPLLEGLTIDGSFSSPRRELAALMTEFLPELLKLCPALGLTDDGITNWLDKNLAGGDQAGENIEDRN